MQQALDFTAARTRRDEGTEQALANAGHEWHERAVGVALEVFSKAGERGAIFEDVRERASEIGLGFPPSPNAWGAVCLSLSKRGLIVRTGEMRASKIVSNHARAAAVWRLASLEMAA